VTAPVSRDDPRVRASGPRRRAEQRRLALATPHAIATTAGVEAFQRGGNALDAALAAAASLTVVLPDNCSLGGDLFALVHRPDGHVAVINASGPAAAAVDVHSLRERYGRSMPAFTVDTVTVPGLLAGWDAIWTFGASRPWPEVFTAAVEHSRSGVPVAESVATALERYSDRLRSDPGMARVFFPSGRPLALGETLVQGELASTLELLGDAGVRAFYEGSLGRTWLQSVTGKGSDLSEDDLAAFEAELAEPLVATYGSREVLTAPPNSQGALLLKTLALLGGDDLDPLSESAPALAEAFHAAADARSRYLADPRAAEVPLDLLLTDTDKPDAPGGEPRNGSGDTVAVAAADDEGWGISLIQSLFDSFGCGVLDPATGIIAHNRGSFFSLDPNSLNVLAPRKRPAHTLSPALVRDDGELRNVLGTMGGLAQTQILTHVLMHLSAGRGVADAIRAPRWTVGSIEAHGDSRSVQAEANVPAPAVEALRAQGWPITTIPALSLDVGDAVAIHRAADGELSAAADPRGPGSAIVC
jgi:gamma-glutamyltranspeptidase